jgi:hypothetical protein
MGLASVITGSLCVEINFQIKYTFSGKQYNLHRKFCVNEMKINSILFNYR